MCVLCLLPMREGRCALAVAKSALGHKPACRSPAAEHPCAANDAGLCAQFNPDNTPAKTRAPSGFRCARLPSTPLPGRVPLLTASKGAVARAGACGRAMCPHACRIFCMHAPTGADTLPYPTLPYPTLPCPTLKEYTRMHACRARTCCMRAPAGADHSVPCAPACAACSCATTSRRQRRRRRASLTRQ